jgi:hypothetical protein
MIAQVELTTLVVIGTDCIDSCKSNYQGTPVASTNKTWPSRYKLDIVVSGIKHHIKTLI